LKGRGISLNNEFYLEWMSDLCQYLILP